MADRPPFRLALISMPWSIFNRPSIQLATLKAFLEREQETCTVDTFHPYLHIARAVGTDAYRKISANIWAGEALFSSLLFKSQKESAETLFSTELSTKQSHLKFDALAERIQKEAAEWLKTVNWSNYDLVGFSVCFSQLLPSLYMASEIKKVCRVPILFGGSSCNDQIGRSLLDHFPQIDFLIDGEGELPLLFLVRTLQNNKKPATRYLTCGQEIQDLNTLPVPDYSPYFQEISTVFPDQPFIPLLPVEFSRGCWWNKCSFCNLNLQWQKYRWKNSVRMMAETEHLSRRHECLNFTFTDNALPIREADSFFHNLAEKTVDLNFFAEIRTITKPERLQTYRKGGLDTVQIGIESLSGSLLKKMRKGTTVMDNIAAMKLCCEYGIRVEGNLIVEFPGTTPEEINETLENLDFVLPFSPLGPARFFLGHSSPMHRNCQDFGIHSTMVHHKIKKLFPKNYHQSLWQLILGYRGDRGHQQHLWQPVIKKIERWQHFHAKRADRKNGVLTVRDGGTFLIIRQEFADGRVLQHRLKGLSRAIYLFCHTPKSFSEILRVFTTINKNQLLTFLNELTLKKIVFMEHETALSLAVRQPGSLTQSHHQEINTGKSNVPE
ncbi:RiPP maturation radical SAM C-methyltransferase [Desulfomarina sp.]